MKTYSKSQRDRFWLMAVISFASLLIIGSYVAWPDWIKVLLAIGTMFSVCRSERQPRVTIESLWKAMPRDVQQKISCHDLKRIVDRFNDQTEQALHHGQSDPR